MQYTRWSNREEAMNHVRNARFCPLAALPVLNWRPVA